MSKFKMYLIVACLLIIIAITFIISAVNNPQASFPWRNSVTYTILGVYGIVTGVAWRLAFKNRGK